MMKVYFTFEPREDLKQPLIAEFPEVEFTFHSKVCESELQQAQVIVTYGDDLTADHIEQAQKLEWIFVASAGVEKMPAEAITKRNLVVSNVRGIHKKPMTESVLAHILALKRGLPYIYENEKRQIWDKKIPTSELNGSTALILGPGAIGAEIGRILKAFDVKTIGCNRSGSPIDSMDETYKIEEILQHIEKADIVISMLPSTASTKHLLTYEHFENMKKSAIFLNFGRGDVVKEEELVRALQNDEIAHAVLDVFEVEPLPESSPLWQMDNVTVSPHCSSLSSRYVERAFEIFKPSLKKWLANDKKVENPVDLSRGY